MDDDMEMDYMERNRMRRQRISAAIKSAVTFLFSHVGLAAMVIGYSIMGGFLFQALEAPNETKVKLKIRSYKQDKIADIRRLADLMCIRSINADNFTEMVNAIQLQFQQQITHAVKNNGWDGKDETDEATTQWSFAGSLLYAVTVITTIGYGHVAPKTTSGRLVTILYALIGIPLTFLYLSNMGNFMAECFRLFYKKVCCGLCIFCINSQPIDEEYDRMEMAAQNNCAYHDADDDGKVTTVYRDVQGMLRSNLRTRSSSSTSHEGEPALQEGRRQSRADWDSKSLREDDRDRNRVTTSNEIAFRKESKYGVTQSTTKMANDRGRGSSVIKRECYASQGNGSTEMEARYSTTTEEETGLQKDDKSTSQKKVSIDLGKVDRFSCSRLGERIKSSGRNEFCGRRYDQNKERLFRLDKRRLETKRRHSFESGIGAAYTVAWPQMFDKSVEVSEAQFCDLKPRCGRDPDGLRSATSSSFSPLFDNNSSSERVGIKGHKKLTATPSGSSRVKLPAESKYMSSASDISPNSNATETSESKDCIPLRRLPSRSRTSESTSQQRLNAQTNDATWAPNGVLPADMSKCAAEGDRRNGTDDDDDDEQQRVMFGQMMAKRYRLSRSEAMIDDAEVSVPISVCLIIIGLYIFCGSILFTLWEDWDYLTGSYFCFVTLSTIGFGDIVPGTDMTEWAAHQKLVLCSLWLVVGLSLLAMCFNLMQEEVKDRCKWLGHKLGILKDE